MNKTIIISLSVLVAFFPGNTSLAQSLQNKTKPDQYRAVHWAMEEGLSANELHTIIKDKKGFLWIGNPVSGELCRFDGAFLKKYFPDTKKRGTINSRLVGSFQLDSLDNIWMGTDKGISRYDSKADTFTNFPFFIGNVSSKQFISPFWSTKEDVFCMEPGGLITAFNIHTLKRKQLVRLSENDNPGVHYLSINHSFFDERSNSIWVLALDNHKGRALEQIFLDGRIAQFYFWPCYDKNTHNHKRDEPNHRLSAEDMKYDPKRNSIWINSGEGLLEFSLADKQFREAEAIKEFTKLKDYDRYVGLDMDKNGRIWFATKPKGILIYDPATGKLQPLFSNTELQNEVGEHNLRLYCDRDNIVWASYYLGKGIYEILPYDPPVVQYAANPKSKESLSSGINFKILPGPNGQVWIGTNDGLNIFDPATEKFKTLREKDLRGIKGNIIVPYHIDTIQQKAWIGASTADYSDLSLYEMDIKTRICRPVIFRTQHRLYFHSPHIIVPFKKGLLIPDEVLGIFEIKENSLFADLIFPFEKRIDISRIEIAEERFLFLRTVGSELLNMYFENRNGKWVRSPHVLDSLYWSSLFYNKDDKTYWVSFDYEIIHYTLDFQVLRNYSLDDEHNGTIVNIQTDKAGNPWFCNLKNELARLDPETGIITKFSETEGYKKQPFDWINSATGDSRGNLYFGVSSSYKTGDITRIYPNRYSSSFPSFVYLRSFSVNEKPFSDAIGANSVEKLSLSYNKNTINIETGTIDFYSKGQGHIRYKLEVNGKDADWQYTSAYTNIGYQSLQPASYRLVMQASSVNTEFNGPEKILIFIISPPFWETWWFRIIAALFVFGVFYMVVRYRTKQKFLLQLERSEKEREIAEIKQKATEMEMQALRAQMNPHFIFNSLNSINRFILQNNRLQASEYLTKFSKLVRMILQNSQASLITLESELEALGLYLEMEALRFNYHFDYKISVPKDLDVEVLKVPPLILQPYVENAIWHGLMHKEEKGQLDIKVSQKGDHLYFRITDDGIGRKKASELASKSATKHKSMGLRITADRIAMMQHSNGEESPVKINDLAAPDGTAAGTEVVIKTPLLYD